MEPGQERLSGGLEKVPFSSAEYGANNPELRPEQSNERVGEKSPEPATARAEAAQIAMPSLPTPVLPTQTSTPVSADDDIPSVAADDDLIEKEWVDKAKKIITETRDDPHRREREVGKLQVDYLKKRYGKDLGASD